MTHSLVTPQWLNDHIDDPNLIILDASLKSKRSNVPQSFETKCIPTARYIDLKTAFSNGDEPYPNTFPSVDQFEAESRKLGINGNSLIVVYDVQGIFSSPRIWWMFKTMGHNHVAVLNGGFPAWINAGFQTSDAYTVANEMGNFKSRFLSNSLRDFNAVLENIDRMTELIVDARSEGRFNGTEKEPREGLRSGCIPGSVNLPYTELLENHQYKSIEELKAIFEPYMNETRRLTFSCGSGVTACILLLGAQLVLENDMSIYDGSWTEWAQKHN